MNRTSLADTFIVLFSKKSNIHYDLVYKEPLFSTLFLDQLGTNFDNVELFTLDHHHYLPGGGTVLGKILIIIDLRGLNNTGGCMVFRFRLAGDRGNRQRFFFGILNSTKLVTSERVLDNVGLQKLGVLTVLNETGTVVVVSCICIVTSFGLTENSWRYLLDVLNAGHKLESLETITDTRETSHTLLNINEEVLHIFYHILDFSHILGLNEGEEKLIEKNLFY